MQRTGRGYLLNQVRSNASATVSAVLSLICVISNVPVAWSTMVRENREQSMSAPSVRLYGPCARMLYCFYRCEASDRIVVCVTCASDI